MSITRTAERARAALDREIRSLTLRHDAACRTLHRYENAFDKDLLKIERQRVRVSSIFRALQAAILKRGI